MLRKLIQTVLCFILCPLLVAQQAASSEQSPAEPESHHTAQSKGATITLRRGTTVPLFLLDTVSSATAQVGQTVRFAVSEDVVVDGTVVIPKGTPISGVVTHVRKAILGKRDGVVEAKPVSLTLPGGSSVELREPSGDGGDGVCEGFVNCMGLFVVAIPLSVLSLPIAAVAMIKEPPQRQRATISGNDQTLPLCGQRWGVTTKKIRVGPPVPTQTQPLQPTVDVDSVCSGR